MISVITVTKNSEKTIARTVNSVLMQQGVDYEHVIKDACSADSTIHSALEANPLVNIHCREDAGIYDAMNQGFLASSGDVIGFLNSDDYYADNLVLSDVKQAFEDTGCDFVYGDILMISRHGNVFREWRTGDIGPGGLTGTQIPHPAFFVKRELLERLVVPFDPSYRISADLKQQLIVINRWNSVGCYLRRALTIMEIGGESTGSVSGYFRGWRESFRAYSEVQGRGALIFVLKKVCSKLKGLRIRRSIETMPNTRVRT